MYNPAHIDGKGKCHNPVLRKDIRGSMAQMQRIRKAAVQIGKKA